MPRQPLADRAVLTLTSLCMVVLIAAFQLSPPAMQRPDPDQPVQLSKPVSSLPIAGQRANLKSWTLEDLTVDPYGDPSSLTDRLRVTPKSDVALKGVGGGTMDIGEIAVLEDDGTLIDIPAAQTNTIAIVNRFYETHGDEYDQLVLFTASNFAGDIDPEAGFAFFQLTGGQTAGINRFQGIPNANEGLSRLLGWCNMNDLPEYPASFSLDFFGSGIASGVEILGQEFEHAWGAFVQPHPSTGADILGRNDAHWSFFLHHPGTNNASPMEGNRWRNMGGGTFVTTEAFSGLSELDEYLMGLRPPEDVVPFYVIDFDVDPFSDSSFSALNVTVTNGMRLDLTIEDIVANHGPRLPAARPGEVHTYRIAFVLVIPQGTVATPGDIVKINSFRLAWESYFSTTTEGLGAMDTTLGPPAISQSDPFAAFGAESDDLFTFFEYVQGVTLDGLALAEPSGIRSMHFDGDWAGGDELRSKTIDLSPYFDGELMLHYATQRTGGGDSPEPGVDLRIEYFNNAGNWLPLNILPGDGPDETTFVLHETVIPADGYHDGFRYRIRRHQGGVGPLDDWFVDDVALALQPICPADADHSGDVDIDDFLKLLTQWGTCPMPCTPGERNVPDTCSADSNRDCEVGIEDFLAVLSGWGDCPVINDDAADARLIVSGSVGFDNTGATTDGPADCPGLEKDVWFCYQAECSGIATASLCGTGFDALFAVYDDCDPLSMALVECAAAGCDIANEISFMTIAGNSYMIRVGGNNGATGAGVLTIDCITPPPANDDCANAIAISDGLTPFSTIAATTDGIDHLACQQGSDSGATVQDIWFLYTPSCTGTVTISTCGLVDFDSDLVLYNFTASCIPGNADVLACNDDGPDPPCTGWSSMLSAPVDAGQSYLLRVGGWSTPSDVGTGTLDITCVP